MSTYGITDQNTLAKKIREKEGLGLVEARKEALKRLKKGKLNEEDYQTQIAKLKSQYDTKTAENETLKSQIKLLRDNNDTLKTL